MKINVKVLRPMLPNFLRLEGTEHTLSVAILDEAEAVELWDHWKAEWVAHVRNKRLLAQADKVRAALPQTGVEHG